MYLIMVHNYTIAGGRHGHCEGNYLQSSDRNHSDQNYLNYILGTRILNYSFRSDPRIANKRALFFIEFPKPSTYSSFRVSGFSFAPVLGQVLCQIEVISDLLR